MTIKARCPGTSKVSSSPQRATLNTHGAFLNAASGKQNGVVIACCSQSAIGRYPVTAGYHVHYPTLL
eukprot:3365004-Pyramimonas_sp.AAC.1